MDKFELRNNDFGCFIISLLLYLCIVLGIFLKLSFVEEPKKFTDSRDAFMDVTIIEREPSPVIKAPEKQEEIVKEIEPKKEPEKKTEEPKPDTSIKPLEPVSEPEPIKQEQPKESEIRKAESDFGEKEPVKKEDKPNLQDLFKTIDTKKLKKDNVAKAQPKEQSRKKPEKTQTDSQQKKASDVINALNLDKTAKTPKSQMTGEYNEYFGLISRILQQEWSTYKADSAAKVEVEIVIDVDGSFVYDVKKLSYDEKFNDKVRDFLQAMTFKRFPPPTKLGRAAKFATVIEDKLE